MPDGARHASLLIDLNKRAEVHGTAGSDLMVSRGRIAYAQEMDPLSWRVHLRLQP